MKRYGVVVCGAVVALFMAASGMADLAIVNGTFDTAAVDNDVDDWFDADSIDGNSAWWTVTSDVQGPNPFPDNSVMLGQIWGDSAGRGNRWLYQEIGTKVEGVNYTVSLDYAQPTDGSTDRSVAVQIDFYQGLFPGAADDVDLLTGGLPLIASLTTPYTSAVGAGIYESFSGTVDLSAANTVDPVWIRISNLPGAGTVDDGSWVCIDNVSIIPEPTTISLIGLAAVVVFLRRRRGIP